VATISTQRTAVLVGRHPLLLDAIGQAIERVPAEVLGKLGVLEDAVELVEESRSDLFVVDVDDADATANPLDAVRSAVDGRPELRVVVMATSEDPEAVGDAFAAGASSYVLKRTGSDDLAATVRQLFTPSVYHAPHPDARRHLHGSAHLKATRLTRREREILSFVVEGRTNGEIARTLWVTEQTVKFHLGNIYRKLGVVNRTQASYWAHGLGIVVARARSLEEARSPLQA
jgi:DNA-binding NarL/FixJ family response regulator